MANPNPSLDRGYILNIIEGIFLALAFTSLAARIYVRTRVTKNLGWDDFFIVLATVTALVGLSMGMTAEHFGLGKHIDSITSDDAIYQAVKWDYVQSLPLGLAAMFTKISIFIFMNRVFVNTQTKWTWRWTLHFVNVVNIVANIISATTVLAQCTPVQKLWDPSIPGTCWPPKKQMAFGIFQGVASAFCDLVFSGLPVVFLWNVQISVRIKVGICSLMGLGLFTAACAIVRTYIANTEDYADITYNDLPWNIWIDMETICGIVAACLPTIRPLLKEVFLKTSSLLSYFSGKPHMESFSNPGYPLPEIAPKEPHGFNSRSNLRSTTDTDVIRNQFTQEAEAWYGIPEFDVLAQNITVPGISPLFPQAHCTANDEICQVTTGEGEINAATTISAIAYSSLFDLGQTYFLIAGIAGVSPKVATIGSVTFARYAVAVALQYEIDAREKPLDWNTGYFPQGSSSPTEYPTELYGTEVFEVNEPLRQIAISFAQTASLNDTADAMSYRALYASTVAYTLGSQAPSVVACDTATSDVYFTGALLADAFENTTSLFTNGSGIYCTTQQEDNATLEALLRAATNNLVDFSRIIIMRTASDFDRPYANQTILDNLLVENQGYVPSIENIYFAGIKVVEGILNEWKSKFAAGIKATNYVGDIFGTLGGQPDFGPGSIFVDGPSTFQKRGLKERRAQVEGLLKNQESVESNKNNGPGVYSDSENLSQSLPEVPFSVNKPLMNDLDSVPEFTKFQYNHEMFLQVPDLLNDNSTWAMIELGLQEPLPPQDTIDELNQIYFTKVHGSVPIIHQYRFLAAMNLTPNGRPSVSLRYAMWALAASVTGKYKDMQSHFHLRARKYADMDETAGRQKYINIRHAQAWILIGLYEFKMMMFPNAWLTTGRATRFTQLLGLHRMDRLGLDVKQTLPISTDSGEKEERRRTFWMAFCMDRSAAVGTGWPLIIDERDIVTFLPSTEDQFEQNLESVAISLKESMDPLNASSLSSFAGVAVVASLTGQIFQHLHRPTGDNNNDHENNEFWKTHRKIDNTLLNISLYLPSHLRLPAGSSNPNTIFLNMSLQSAVICLHQAAIFKAEKLVNTSVIAESKERCLTAAAEITSIMKRIAHTDLSKLNVYTPFSLYLATRIFSQISKADPHDDNASSSTHFLLSALTAIKDSNPLVESYMIQLDLEGIGLSALQANVRVSSQLAKSMAGISIEEEIEDSSWITFVSPLVRIIEQEEVSPPSRSTSQPYHDGNIQSSSSPCDPAGRITASPGTIGDDRGINLDFTADMVEGMSMPAGVGSWEMDAAAMQADLFNSLMDFGDNK
ncbi:hypothetical protein G7Y89_g12482 [Cudoniella acicularis]|uniref:Xylanolytic transcriptional activator regulatory domain-containing protein n=1 Tax=Cudoniella acicularis TaxID=354080 RepID=A0A8H4R8Q7_9HELO|nr:hypothetical protein G7Y89_g12482 [Cudoniella acicularis]